MEERYLREKQFHEHRYGENSRQVVSKYYTISGKRLEFYEHYLASRSPERRVLEYGCGQGSHAFSLAENGAQVTAIDLSETAIEQARETARLKDLGINFRVMNAEALDFEDGTFDIICGTAIIHHLALRKAFFEITRTLRPAGFAIFMEPLGHNPLINLYRKLSPRLRTEDEHPLKLEDFELARLFFREVDVYYFHLLSLLAVPFRETRFFSNMLQILHGVDQVLFRYVPFARKYAWYSVVILRHPRVKEHLREA
jgi:SAM-dependent methyltransferase